MDLNVFKRAGLPQESNIRFPSPKPVVIYLFYLSVLEFNLNMTVIHHFLNINRGFTVLPASVSVLDLIMHRSEGFIHVILPYATSY